MHRRYHLPIATTTPLPPLSEDGDARSPAPGEPARDVLDDAGRIGTMRGASVQFDAQRLGRVALGLVMGTLAVLAVVFTVAGNHSNDQIDRLHNQGVAVTVTVSGCLGLLGGSGSNAAGYSCHGAYTLDGVRYHESLPGTAFYRPGTEVAAIAVPGDPALVSPVRIVDSQRSSASVFILPAVLAFALLVLVGVVLLRRRSTTSGHGAP